MVRVWQSMLNVPVSRLYVSMNSKAAICLISVFAVSIFAPLASASGMQGCTLNGGTCDSWDKSDDGTPNQQDWIIGVYEFDLVDTSTINMQMSWALHEFNRSSLGLDGALMNAALAAEGMSAQDGAPADLIRNYFDQTTAGPGTPTVKQKLVMEVNDTIQELLNSGFGTVNQISTSYINSITNSGITTTCSDDKDTDTQEEAGLSNNVFDPPICFTVSASVTLSTSTFNLGSVDPLTLERVYRGMLVMGSDITSEFDLFSEPGHSSVFEINPPDFATVKSVDSTGIQIVKSGPPSYMAAQWTINNLDAPITGQRISQTVSVEIGHRNSTQTNSVEILPDDTGITLEITLDLSDESSAHIDIVTGIKHLDETTMSDWGISIVDITENAKIPWVTSDGIRLAYHSDLVDLDNFTDNFPIDLVGDAIEEAVSDVSDIQIGEIEWVSDSQTEGLFVEPGGLNYTHNSCPENLPIGVEANYCIIGPSAMDGSNPVYLKATSSTFSLQLLDLIKEQIEDDDLREIIDPVRESDLQKLLDSGLVIEADFGQDILQDMIPEDLPPTELELEIVLPSWLQSATGDQSIRLVERTVGEDQLSITMSGPDAYDPRHPILDSSGDVICSSEIVDWSCIDSDIDLDISDLNFNEWGPSIDLTASFSASLDVYRIKVPQDVLDELKSGNNSVSMEAIPSDLIRLAFDLGSRIAEPEYISHDFGECGKINITLTTQGLEDFVDGFGILITDCLHQKAKEASEESSDFGLDLSDIQLITSLDNLGGIGASMGDETPITLSIKIPEFTIEAGVNNGWSGIIDGNPVFGLTTEIQSPLIAAINGFKDVFTNIGLQFLQTSGSGINIDNNGNSFEPSISATNLELDEDTQTELKGQISFTLPDGITLKDFQTANGWEKVSEEDGRQKIILSLDSLSAGEEFSFTIEISWFYVLSQIWIYPAILLSLIIWRVRARRKKKKRKREEKKKAETKIISTGKGGLSDADFAALSAGYDPTVKKTSDFDLYDDDYWN